MEKDIKSRIANLKLSLSKCKTCLGCNRLEQENFTGERQCRNYRQGIFETQIQVQKGEKTVYEAQTYIHLTEPQKHGHDRAAHGNGGNAQTEVGD